MKRHRKSLFQMKFIPTTAIGSSKNGIKSAKIQSTKEKLTIRESQKDAASRSTAKNMSLLATSEKVRLSGPLSE